MGAVYPINGINPAGNIDTWIQTLNKTGQAASATGAIPADFITGFTNEIAQGAASGLQTTATGLGNSLTTVAASGKQSLIDLGEGIGQAGYTSLYGIGGGAGAAIEEIGTGAGKGLQNFAIGSIPAAIVFILIIAGIGLAWSSAGSPKIGKLIG